MSDSAVLDRRVAARDPVAHRALPALALAVYDRLDAVEQEWRQFEQRADCTPFQTFDWLSIWFEQVGPHLQSRPAIVVVRKTDAATLCILPLAVTPGLI